MRIKILGRVWNLRFAPHLGPNDGFCDPPTTTNKSIVVAKGLSEKDQLEILVHEMLHAGGWHFDEEYVTQFARDISHVLWRLGYRQVKR
ncbi:MAG TPA: hypothetical protein VGI75_04155 [Pirellulales bacterium]